MFHINFYKTIQDIKEIQETKYKLINPCMFQINFYKKYKKYKKNIRDKTQTYLSLYALYVSSYFFYNYTRHTRNTINKTQTYMSLYAFMFQIIFYKTIQDIQEIQEAKHKLICPCMPCKFQVIFLKPYKKYKKNIRDKTQILMLLFVSDYFIPIINEM